MDQKRLVRSERKPGVRHALLDALYESVFQDFSNVACYEFLRGVRKPDVTWPVDVAKYCRDSFTQVHSRAAFA